MSYINFDKSKPLDVIPIGRIAIDFNPTDMNMPLSESSNFNKYVGGSPANIAVGLARLGAKCGFIARVSDDQFGDYVENYFKNGNSSYRFFIKKENIVENAHVLTLMCETWKKIAKKPQNSLYNLINLLTLPLLFCYNIYNCKNLIWS